MYNADARTVRTYDTVYHTNVRLTNTCYIPCTTLHSDMRNETKQNITNMTSLSSFTSTRK